MSTHPGSGGLTGLAEVRAGLALLFLFAMTPVWQRIVGGLALGLLVTLAVIATVGVLVPFGLAMFAAVVGWMFITGFVVNTGGSLTLGEPSLVHLALVVGVATVARTMRQLVKVTTSRWPINGLVRSRSRESADAGVPVWTAANEYDATRSHETRERSHAAVGPDPVEAYERLRTAGYQAP